MKIIALAALVLAACVSACDAKTSVAEAATLEQNKTSTPHIVLDQFGYLPRAPKIAFVREPQTGFDVGLGSPAAERYDLINLATNRAALPMVPQRLSIDELYDPLSGDTLWTLDFSHVTEPGRYVISNERGDRSPEFEIGDDVYKPVLRAALRTFYYQRAGFAKSAPFADKGWTDKASHLGKGQDSEARDFFRKTDESTARDLRGGWYDAGDYNQYMNWTAEYVRTLMFSWLENPKAWGDDFGLPESGNGVPDVIDEALWGLDWLERMQREDGAVNSILGRDVASTPSAAKGPSYYGPHSTSATLSAAGTYAFAAVVLKKQDAKRHAARIARLKTRALKAWAWSEANPNVTFYNNDSRDNSLGLGAGQQEVDDATRIEKRFAAASYLYMLTGETRFAEARDRGIGASEFLKAFPTDAYHNDARDAAIARQYSDFDTVDIAWSISLNTGISLGYVPDAGSVHWGSNSTIARLGVLWLRFGRQSEADSYLHYLHGANPLGLVYLSNTGGLGAERSVNKVYHSWFGAQKTPPPGFLTGGPNPTYTWDACCPSACGDAGANRRCGTSPPSPPYGQPPLKAYADFNDDWPLNSWQISENSNLYQSAYLRLLAHYVE